MINSGLVDQASFFSTKPLSRWEAAEILAQAIRKIEKGEGTYGFQKALLEDQLETLIEEFKWELQRMGAYPFAKDEKARWFLIKPLEMAQAKVGYAEDPYLLENRKADRRAQGFNLRVGGASRVELAEYLSLYVHPEYRYDEDQNKGYLLETYGKLTFANIELEVGRDSLWWGPGYHGSLLLSDHALPLNLVKLSSATPFQLPWVFRYMGSFDLSLFLARLEENRDFPHAKLLGMRIDWSPISFLEFGASQVMLYNGEGRPSWSVEDYWEAFTARTTALPEKLETDRIISTYAALRLRNIGRYVPLADSIKLFAELGGEDVPGKRHGIPFPLVPYLRYLRKACPGGIWGILLQDLFTIEGLDLRAEYARTHEVWYRHGTYTSGYTYKGVILGHHMGGDSDDLYFRLSHWIHKNLQVALDIDQERHGLSKSLRIRERYVEPSVLLFRPQDIPLSALLSYRFVHTENAGFQKGEDHKNHLVRLDLSYHFCYHF